MIILKSDREIALMREAGKLLAKVHEELAKHVKVGITTKELDKIAHDMIVSHGATPSFLGYYDYPATICASVNEEVVHGIPSNRKLIDGDIVSLDIGLCLNGYHSDAARSYCVGNCSEESHKLVEVTKQSFFEGLKYCKAGNRMGDVSNAIQKYAEEHGFSLVRDYTGHGIGQSIHEDPQVPNYGPAGKGITLKAGMTLAIEPMVNLGVFGVKVLSDNWTAVTKDRKKSAHYENTVVITDGEPEVLTLTEDEK